MHRRTLPEGVHEYKCGIEAVPPNSRPRRHGRHPTSTHTRLVIASSTVTSIETPSALSSIPHVIRRGKRATALLALSALAGVLGSCGVEPSGPADIGVTVAWLDQPAGTLPDSVFSISVTTFLGDDDVMGREAEFTVAGDAFTDLAGRRSLVQENLPAGVPVRMTLLGFDVARAVVYVGHVGPLVLETGQRRFVDVQMYPIGTSTVTPDTTLTGRFLQTATSLPDGRVLVAGGFSAITRIAVCPAPFPATAHCFAATGSRDAYVFVPASGRFFRVVDRLLEARGGHTATALPDGRILLAGGASDALLEFSPIGDVGSPRGWGPALYARNEAGAATARATFEIFDPERNPEANDPERNGDEGRGGFVGAADAPMVPGRLNGPRFLHAAASVPGTNLVLLAGGANPEAAPGYEIYDDRRAGGYGVYPNDRAMLLTARAAPSAIGVGTGASAKVWIVGGASAGSNDQLAEIWSQPTTSMPNGSIVTATTTGFPTMAGGAGEPHPEFSLIRPELAVVGAGGSHLLGVGWLGPQCAAGATLPLFAGSSGGAEELCPTGMPERSFTTRLTGGATQGTASGSPHALAASARLDDGSFVVTGGVSNLVMTAQSAVDRFTGTVMADRAVRDSGAARMVTLRAQRALHASAALPGHGVLSTGGVVFTPDTSGATLVTPVAEVLYLPAL